jgi:hypothetical protein
VRYSLADLRSRLALLDAEVQAKEAAVNATPEGRALVAARVLRDGAERFISALEAEAAANAAEAEVIIDAEVIVDTDSRPLARRSFRHSIGNADIIGAIIAESPDGIHLRDIQRIVAERGHDFDGEQVRSSVTYLRRRGDAENIGRGVWRPTSPKAAVDKNDPAAEAGPFSIAPLVVAGGG